MYEINIGTILNVKFFKCLCVYHSSKSVLNTL